MVKRLISCKSSEIKKFTAEELKQSIKASEGRTVCCEMIPANPTLGKDLTQAEVARSFGCDLMLLNGFDCFNPVVNGVGDAKNPIARLKELVGRPIGINLEPVDVDAVMLEGRVEISKGRTCSVETLKIANELGLDFICLTGNPGTGVTNKEICKFVKIAKEVFNGMVIAGKMHAAGSSEAVSDLNTVKEFIDAGADVILVPAVGTVPGFTDAELVEIVKESHKHGALVMSAIGTSQETSNNRVIEDIAIRNKVAGVDIQHIGDAGYAGMAEATNIFALSVAIRGMRHTVARISSSVNR